MKRYVLFNKPFQVLTQFTDNSGRNTLADYIDIPGIYGAGRLDFDSEGLLILTDDGNLIHGMMEPKFKISKTYYAQVEGQPNEADLDKLRSGLMLKDGKTTPCLASTIDEPDWLWPRNPPIRDRKAIPTTWLSITLTEGKNRQVRRMTAAIGHPTLRLVRFAIGDITVEHIKVGQYIEKTSDFIKDNGIKWITKKSSSKAASYGNGVKRQDRYPLRNQRSQNRNRTGGKTQPDNP